MMAIVNTPPFNYWGRFLCLSLGVSCLCSAHRGCRSPYSVLPTQSLASESTLHFCWRAPPDAPTSPEALSSLGPLKLLLHLTSGFDILDEHQGDSCRTGPQTMFEATLLLCNEVFPLCLPDQCPLWKGPQAPSSSQPGLTGLGSSGNFW